jgi:endonuclease/exonuclease/phosphatase (EEP) superfamily protein YafD
MGVSFRFERRGTSTPTGVATLARAPAQSATVQHSEGREPLARTPKAALVTTYAIAGTDRMLLVVNVHGINFRRAHWLSDQLDALRPLIAAHIGPVIFAGDLNTHHGPRMRVLEQFAADLGLQPVFGPGPDARTRHLRWALDHAYVREIRVVDPIVLDASEGSDHQPLAFRALLDGNPDETPR